MIASDRALSIVVPTHNTAALTLRCVETIHDDPDASRCEIIVVDDGSQDGTATLLAERFPQVRILRNDDALGFSGAANRGLAAAGAPLLWLLNSDTEVSPGTIAAILAAFGQPLAPDILGPGLRYADGTPQWSGGAEPSMLWLFVLTSGVAGPLRRLPFYRALRPLTPQGPTAIDWVTGAAMAMRRSTWQTAGPFDTGYGFYAQDLEFCRRAAAAGARIELRPDICVLHHHGASISKACERSHQNYPLLWGDLLRWAQRHRGAAWARRARHAMMAGAWLRLAARSITFRWPGATRSPAWCAETAALRDGLAALKARRIGTA